MDGSTIADFRLAAAALCGAALLTLCARRGWKLLLLGIIVLVVTTAVLSQRGLLTVWRSSDGGGLVALDVYLWAAITASIAAAIYVFSVRSRTTLGPGWQFVGASLLGWLVLKAGVWVTVV